LSDQPRRLPDRPSLRHLKIEAKRRLSTGEFATLHQAQLAIAREHGLPSWTALKERIEAETPASHALTHVRWVMSRFAAAGTPGWTPPDEEELRWHFDDRYLSLVPTDWVTHLFTTLAERLREGLTDVQAEPLYLRAHIADLRIEATTEPEPPHRLRSLQMYPARELGTDLPGEPPTSG